MANLDVELLQSPTGSCNCRDPEIADHLAPTHAHLLQLEAVDREHLQAGIRERGEFKKVNCKSKSVKVRN